jgi:DNA-binding XRE family transcriptional regulator
LNYVKEGSGIMSLKSEKKMDKAKRKRLESKGWKVGTVEEFLELSPEESAYIELKLKLSESLKRYREERNLTQTQLAQIVGSSQSRVAKMEVGDPSVSIDLLIRSLFALGISKREMGRIIASPRQRVELR